jgi:uncharacterized protein YjbJ (UPF0337 family)
LIENFTKFHTDLQKKGIGQEATGNRQEARGKRQEVRGKRQEARGNRQEVRGKRELKKSLMVYFLTSLKRFIDFCFAQRRKEAKEEIS